jgi:hypothetical protein
VKYKLIEGIPDALCIHCADPRFQTAFRQFIREELKVTIPMVIALPGVTSHFGMQAVLPKNWYAMRSSIETMASRHKVARVILINHDDCQGYAKVASHFGGLPKVSDAQRKHIRGLAAYVQKEYLPNASFELYHAKIVGNGIDREVEFEKIL